MLTRLELWRPSVQLARCVASHAGLMLAGLLKFALLVAGTTD